MGIPNNAHNGGTRCPECRAQNTSVKDSRPFGEYTRRRRQCNACSHRWHTLEIPEDLHAQFDAARALVISTEHLNVFIRSYNNLRKAVRKGNAHAPSDTYGEP